MVNDAVMMHKCLKGLLPSYLSDNLVPRVLSYPLSLSLSRVGRREPWERGCLSDKFSTRAIVHDRQTRYICYRGVKIWITAAAVSEPEASERGSSLIGKKLHYRGTQSLSYQTQGIVVMRDSKI